MIITSGVTKHAVLERLSTPRVQQNVAIFFLAVIRLFAPVPAMLSQLYIFFQHNPRRVFSAPDSDSWHNV